MPSYLHRDHLGSVRAISDATGAKIESAVYKPFGEQTETLSPANLTPESKGWIGERYDADAGLQYLNARYYDPVLGLFLQPDWFEVLKPGVGTNRFSNSFNDPVNKLDPNGNTFREVFSNFINSFFGSSTQPTSSARTEQNARALASASVNHVKTMPSRAASDLASAYEFARKGPIAGAILPDVGAAANGDILEIAGLMPALKLPGKVLDAAVDAARVVCSFDGSTLVLSERGLVPISSIQPLHDRVWSTDERTQQSAWNRVLAQSVARYDHEVRVTIRDPETGDEQTITSNRIHPYFAQVPESEPFKVASEGFTYTGPIINGRWIDAGNLKPGYRLLNDDGAWVEVVAVDERPHDLMAWNLTVENAHSFYVAETVDDDAVWVHNSCPSLNKLNHIFGNPSHRLDGLVDELGGGVLGQRAVYEAVELAANGRLADIRLLLNRSGNAPSSGITVTIGSTPVQLSGGRIVSEISENGTVVERFAIGSFSAAIREVPW